MARASPATPARDQCGQGHSGRDPRIWRCRRTQGYPLHRRQFSAELLAISEAGAQDGLLSQASVVAGTCNHLKLLFQAVA